MQELFSDKDLIDPEVYQAVKMYKKAGWKEIDNIGSLFESILKTHGQENKVPWMREQIRMIKKNWKGLKKYEM